MFNLQAERIAILMIVNDPTVCINEMLFDATTVSRCTIVGSQTNMHDCDHLTETRLLAQALR